jgi:hypothetical protein
MNPDDDPSPDDELLAEATRSARAEDASVQPPPALLGRVMQVVRAEPRQPRPLLVSAEPGARVEVSGRAVTRLLLAAVEELDGVRARTCTVHVADDGGLHVELAIAARTGEPLPALVAAVRRQVSDVTAAAFALPVRAVDVTVDDLF